MKLAADIMVFSVRHTQPQHISTTSGPPSPASVFCVFYLLTVALFVPCPFHQYMDVDPIHKPFWKNTPYPDLNNSLHGFVLGLSRGR